MTGRPRHYTEAQYEDIRRRYQLYLDNLPSKIAKEYGLSRSWINRVGKGLVCLPRHLKNHQLRLRYTSTLAMLHTSKPTTNGQ